jgi:hypothetical protein
MARTVNDLSLAVAKNIIPDDISCRFNTDDFILTIATQEQVILNQCFSKKISIRDRGLTQLNGFGPVCIHGRHILEQIMIDAIAGGRAFPQRVIVNEHNDRAIPYIDETAMINPVIARPVSEIYRRVISRFYVLKPAAGESAM